MKTITIEVGLPPRPLCGNGRAGGFKRSDLVAVQRRQAELAAYQALAQLPGTLKGPLFPKGTRVKLDAVVHRDPLWSARALDDDNFWAGMKAARDGLADAGVVANDRQFKIGDISWLAATPLTGKVVLTLSEEA